MGFKGAAGKIPFYTLCATDLFSTRSDAHCFAGALGPCGARDAPRQNCGISIAGPPTLHEKPFSIKTSVPRVFLTQAFVCISLILKILGRFFLPFATWGKHTTPRTQPGRRFFACLPASHGGGKRRSGDLNGTTQGVRVLRVTPTSGCVFRVDCKEGAGEKELI